VKTVTARGIREVYLLAFIGLETRKAIVSPGTEHPDSAWVAERTEDFFSRSTNREQKPTIVIHDRDTMFAKELVAKLVESDARTNVLPKASPNLNGRCERFIQTIKFECPATVCGLRQASPQPFNPKLRHLLQPSQSAVCTGKTDTDPPQPGRS